MRWGKTDPISTLMLAIAGIAAFSVLPLSDSIPQTRVGPTYVRLLLGITVLLRGYELVSCKTSAALCREMNHDFRWPERQLVNLTGCVWQCYAERYPNLRGKYGLDVNKLYEEYVYSGFKRGEDCSCPNSTPTHITATASNSTSVIVDAGPMFSTLDIYESCHSLLIVLSLRMLLSSLTRPTTTNCIRQPSKHIRKPFFQKLERELVLSYVQPASTRSKNCEVPIMQSDAAEDERKAGDRKRCRRDLARAGCCRTHGIARRRRTHFREHQRHLGIDRRSGAQRKQ